MLGALASAVAATHRSVQHIRIPVVVPCSGRSRFLSSTPHVDHPPPQSVIVVIGGGAMGSLLSGLLAGKGNGGQRHGSGTAAEEAPPHRLHNRAVYLLSSHMKEHVRAIQSQGGLAVQPYLTGESSFIAPVTGTHAVDDIISRHPHGVNMVFILVKSLDASTTASHQAVALLRGRMDPASPAGTTNSRRKHPGVVVSMMNGVGHYEIIKHVCRQDAQVIVGTTSHGAKLVGPGIVQHTGPGVTMLVDDAGAGADGDRTGTNAPSSGLQWVQWMLASGGIDAQAFSGDHRESVLWTKLLVNACINPLTAILGVHNGVLTKDPHAQQLMKMIVGEFMRVVNARGTKLIHIQDEAAAYAYVARVCDNTSKNISSMLADIQQQRPQTEVSGILNPIVREGKRLFVPTPYIECIMNIVCTLSSTQHDRIS